MKCPMLRLIVIDSQADRQTQQPKISPAFVTAARNNIDGLIMNECMNE